MYSAGIWIGTQTFGVRLCSSPSRALLEELECVQPSKQSALLINNFVATAMAVGDK